MLRHDHSVQHWLWGDAMHTLASAWDEGARQQQAVIPAPRLADDIRSVCHDLRGHLAAIGMIANALRSDTLIPATAERRLGSLLDEVALTTEMVRRVVTGERAVAALSFDALVAQCATRASAVSGVAVSCRVEPATVAADRLQLIRLVSNLLDNATRAASPGGLVEVRVQRRVDLHDAERPAEALAVLTVEDNGPGFGAARPGAAGLGLVVAREVAAESGGTLVLGTSGLGGAMVTVTLPHLEP